jgi:hypothetical protein
MNNSYILAYGTLFFVYAFIGPFLYEQLFYHNRPTTTTIGKENKDHSNKVSIIYSDENLKKKFFFVFGRLIK